MRSDIQPRFSQRYVNFTLKIALDGVALKKEPLYMKMLYSKSKKGMTRIWSHAHGFLESF